MSKLKKIRREYQNFSLLLINTIGKNEALHKKDWKKFKTNNKTIAVNILYVLYSREQIRPAYISKHNSKHENQVISLMITVNEKWHSCRKKIVCFAK